MSLTGSVFGELLGRYFVQEAFDEESKAKSQDLIDMIKTAFAARIPTIDWMDEETKQAALVKLNAVNDKIGYPDKWNDYTGITVYDGSFLLNALIGYGHAFAENIKDAGTAVDRSTWYMDPQDVNAYYDPLMNEMAFPAAILQPPFYHKNYPDALNFGAIGAVMGHEVSFSIYSSKSFHLQITDLRGNDNDGDGDDRV
jgi:putative endopeptidase